MKNRNQLIDRAILRALLDVSTHLLPEQAMGDMVDLLVEPPPLASEFDDRVRDLDSRGLILGVRTDYGVKWKLTDAGRAHCAEHKI